ncbi:hypothetical protein Leryth_014647 [Lithospermum erythrorhizon]|nr:hypothetical protein Leryth_014647 [Lithospermum erythrorhizon]
MVEGLDMSLDELIKQNKTNKMGQKTTKPPPQPRRGDGGGAHGPTRRSRHHHRTTIQAHSFTLPQHRAWRMESVISDNREVEEEEKDEEAKLYVSNLHYEVSNHDIKVLFSDVGELKRYGIHYDRSGRSKGSAEVVFARKSDAIEAMQRYNKARLDGKQMHIELIGPESMSLPVPPNVIQQQMPALVPPPVPHWQMAYDRPSDVTYQQMAQPMPPQGAHLQITPFTPQTVPHWQITPILQAAPHWQRPGFIENPSYGFHKGQEFSQGQTPGKSHGWISAGNLDADMEKHAKRKPGSGSQGQKPKGKRKGKVSADDLDADLDKYLAKWKENTP